jgi:neutral ceramidase
MKTMQRSNTILMILACGALLLGGCATLKPETISIGRPEPLATQDVSETLAGAARADITPPPGIPLAGHSLNGEISRGVRTRLYARALYLKPKSGRPIVLVQADLLSGSRILHHRVAELIASKTDVEAGGLVIAGTHTHSAQGNYFGDAFYDRMASSEPGFQKQLYEFMAQRIAGAVTRAYESRRPAKIAAGSINIDGVNRNRSLPAYLMNTTLNGKKPNELEAVNSELRMIRVDCRTDKGDYVPIGAFSFFSLHPNLDNRETDELYNGDVTAYAEREVEWGIRSRYPSAVDPIHAIANFTHGDMTPNYNKDEKLGYAAMRRIGVIVGKKSLELFDSLKKDLSSSAVIRYRYSEVDVYKNRCSTDQCLCDKPAVGQALVAGANDRPTPVLHSIIGFAPGWPKQFNTDTCQGKKRIVAEAIHYKILPLEEFPHVLFLQAIQIQNTVLLPVPFEVTIEAGRRMMNRCGESGKTAGIPDARYIIMDTANSYWGYCSTPEEYSIQYYEGGHTLYGPGTNGYLASALAGLTADLAKGTGGMLLADWNFTVKEAKNYFPADVTPMGTRKVIADPALTAAGRKNLEPYWSFRWQDLPPARVAFDEPMVSMETSDDLAAWRPLVVDNVPVDDGGYDIAIICTKARNSEGMGVYEARWYNPAPGNGKNYRFKILPRNGQGVLYSPAFR